MRVHDNEPIGVALRRFKRLLYQRGVMWQVRIRSGETFIPATQYRRRKRFKKRLKAREATLQAQKAGEQPVACLEEATTAFWKRTGKP